MINTKREKFSRFCAGGVLALELCFMLYLLVSAFMQTTGMSTGGGEGEVVTFFPDNFFLNTLVAALMLAALYLLLNVLENVSLNTIAAVLLGWTLLFGCVFVCSARLQPLQDSYIVTFFARQCAKGDYSYYHDYFRFFPFQLGFALYEEIFFRIFNIFLPNSPEGFSSVALQLINVFYTAVSFFTLVKISGLLFGSVKVQKLTAVLLLLSVQPLFFCTYMYGNTPAFCFACLGIWLFLLFQRDGKPVFGLLCAASVAAAVLLKLNTLIYFVAIVIVWAICLIRKPSLKSLVCLAVLFALMFAVKPLPQRYYEAKLGESLGSGIPQWSWMAMGLHEGQSCSGWYDAEYTTTAFIENDFDAELTAQNAKTAIKERLHAFSEDPASAFSFFSRKFLSQWNEPTYQSIWINQSRPSYSEYGRMYNAFCVEHSSELEDYMGAIEQLVALGCSFGIVMLLKKRDILSALPVLIILGAMLYHLIFEAKSQQSMGYFVLMIPVAAYGICSFYTILKHERN